MEYVAIVTCLALIQTFVFAAQVGQQRGKHGVAAPAITGAPEFERAFRAHQNTLEQLILFIPGLWIFASYWSAEVAAGLGLVFVITRQLYRNAYVAEPKRRGKSFVIGTTALASLVLGGLFGAVYNLF